MNTNSEITPEVMALARNHVFSNDQSFLLQLSESFARLSPSASNADRIALLNSVTASHIKHLDAADIARARAGGAKDERSRIKAILTSIHATDYEEIAQNFAFETDMPASAAIDALKAMLSKMTVAALINNGPDPLAEREAITKTMAENGVFLPSSHHPASGADKAKSMWSKAIAEVNSEQTTIAQLSIAK